MFCCDKHTFVATKHMFCCDKSMSWQSYELSVRVVAVVLTRCGWRWKSGDPGRWAALLYPELTVCQSYPWMESETHRHTTPTSSTDNSCFTSNALPFCVVIMNYYHYETWPILPMWIIIMMKHHLYYQCELLSWWNITYITNVNYYHDETSPILPMWIIIMMKHCCSTLWPWSITYIIVLHCNHKRLLMISCHAKIIQCHFCNCLHYNHRASLMLLFCIIIMKHHLSFCSMITKHH